MLTCSFAHAQSILFNSKNIIVYWLIINVFVFLIDSCRFIGQTEPFFGSVFCLGFHVSSWGQDLEIGILPYR